MNKKRIFQTVVALIISLTTSQACRGAAVTELAATQAPVSAATMTSPPRPTSTPRATATPDAAGTKQVDDFLQWMKMYYSGPGDPTSMQPDYYPIEDYENSVVTTGQFETALTEIQAVDFLIKTHITMETANEEAPLTGCGIVFDDGISGVVLQQNGETFLLIGNSKSNTQFYGWRHTNPVELDLVVLNIDSSVYWFVGDKALQDIGSSSLGTVGFMTLSGSGYDFGSRCRFTDTKLWVIKK